MTSVPRMETKMKRECVVRPAPTKLVVQVDEFQYSGKLVVPETAKRTPTTGVVVAVGEHTETYKVGDRVTFGMYSGIKLVLRDKQTHEELPPMRVMSEDEILGWLNDTVELEDAGA